MNSRRKPTQSECVARRQFIDTAAIPTGAAAFTRSRALAYGAHSGSGRLVRIRSATFAALGGLVGLVLAVGVVADARAAANPLHCDFDGDGRSDLAVGVPGDNNGRGAVSVSYMANDFITDTVYLLRSLTVPGASAAGQRLGSSLACGDFDGDSYADLAIGIPGENQDRGAIVVMYGSATGLFNKFGTYFNQNAIAGQSAEKGDRFGEALAAGDFNGDGKEDLAIGVPGEDVASGQSSPSLPLPKDDIKDAGMVHVLFGFSGGLMVPAQTFSPVTPGACCVKGSAHYGAALAVGDFDEDGIADLAIGAPYSDVGTPKKTVRAAGAVHLLRGQALVGLALAGQAHFDQSVLGATTPRYSELFGFSLAVGNFDGARGDDLAIGVPDERLEHDFGENDDVVESGNKGYGAVHVLYFSGIGFFPSSSDFIMEDKFSGFGDDWADKDRFGYSLAAGNFDLQHSDDLAIGYPNPASKQGGAVAVIYSNGEELSVGKVQFFYPGDFADGIQTPPPAASFGGSLAVGDYQGDGIADLFIGVPAFGAYQSGAGAVEIKPGVSGPGLGFSVILLHQDLFQPEQKAAETNFKFIADDFFNTTKGEGFGYAIGR